MTRVSSMDLSFSLPSPSAKSLLLLFSASFSSCSLKNSKRLFAEGDGKKPLAVVQCLFQQLQPLQHGVRVPVSAFIIVCKHGISDGPARRDQLDIGLGYL